MGIQLTPDQQAVVTDQGGCLLVSAAAGSGKTRVLVERLFRYVMEEKADVDDFLIITFTDCLFRNFGSVFLCVSYNIFS